MVGQTRAIIRPRIQREDIALDADWIDVSAPIINGMVHWPDNPPVIIERVLDIDRGDGANVSRISMGTHTGTHMDAPVHFLKQGEGIDKLSMSVAMGRARVIQIEDMESIKPDELVRQRVRGGERILFRTRNSNGHWQTGPFIEDFVYVSAEAAEYLAKLGVLMVGIDYLSVGGYRADGAAAHRFLLEAGVWVVEGLDLSGVVQGHYEMICLPLRIAGGDGAPARVLLKPVDLSSKPEG